MKICMFTNTFIPHVGGVARSVSCFAEDLRSLGHRVLVIAPMFPGIQADETEDFVLRVPAIQHFNGSDFSASIPSPFLIHRKLDEFKPDIIHSHHPYLLGDAAMRTAGRRCLPIVFTHHTLYEEYTHYVSSSKTMQKFVTRLSTTYANCCTYVVAPSASIADLIQKRGVTTPVAEIPTGIDFETFQTGNGNAFRKKTGIDETVRLIGHTGRIAPEKNLSYLIRAVKIYLAQDRKAKFLLVGDGPDFQAIRDSFASDNMENRLVAAGKQTGQELIDSYCAMDVFVFSSHSETQGLVVAEAMAAGKPVIALDASGVREVVQDDINGRLLPADAPAGDFADAVDAFFRDPETMKRLAEGAVETARQFDRKKMARKMADLYAEALKNKLREDLEYHHYFRLWEGLMQGLRTEWDLLSSKVEAFADSIGYDEENKP